MDLNQNYLAIAVYNFARAYEVDASRVLIEPLITHDLQKTLVETTSSEVLRYAFFGDVITYGVSSLRFLEKFVTFNLGAQYSVYSAHNVYTLKNVLFDKFSVSKSPYFIGYYLTIK